MSEFTTRIVLADSQTAKVDQFTVLKLTGSNDREVLPVGGSDEKPAGTLTFTWDPDDETGGVVTFDDETAQSQPSILERRELSMYTLVNPELEVIVDSGSSGIDPDDDVMAVDGGAVDVYVAATGNYKLGTARTGGVAGDKIKIAPNPNPEAAP